MFDPEYGDWQETTSSAESNTTMYEYMEGTDLSVQNEHLRNSFKVDDENSKDTINDPFGVFLTGGSMNRIARESRPYNWAPTYVPELPTEIWEAVIGLATDIPGAYDTQDYSSIAAFMFDSRGVCARQRFEATMNDKLAISLVCKRLNSICTPLLFKHLRITSGAQAYAISAALKKNGTAMAKNTIRIDLALEGNHAWTKAHTVALMSIFLCCPNLVSFSTSFCDPDPWTYSLPNLIESLAKHNRVRRVEVKAEGDVLRNIGHFLQDIEVLWLLPCHRQTQLDTGDRYRLPRLRALIVSENCETEARKIEAPSLRACIMQKNDISILPNLKLERIEYLSALDAPKIISTLDMWPSLRTLSVKYEELARRNIDWPRGLQHPNLECIVIEDVSYNFLHAASVGHLDENMKRIIDRDIFPYLRRVKVHLLFKTEMMPETEENIRWEWLSMCLKRGLRVEMLQGNVERTGNQWHTLSLDELEELNDILFAEDEPPLKGLMHFLP